MAQSDPAQPLLNLRNKLIDFMTKAKEWGESGTKKPNTGWEEQVKKNNEEFRKQAEKDATKKVVKKPTQSAGLRKKPIASKPYPKKRVAGKQ